MKAPQLPAARWDLFKHWQVLGGAAYEALVVEAWKVVRKSGFYKGCRLDDIRSQIDDARLFRLADEITTRKTLGPIALEAWQYFVARPTLDYCLDGENEPRTRRRRLNAVQPEDTWDYVVWDF